MFIVSLLSLAFCTPSRYVKPLQKKQGAASFSFGGPLIKFSNAPIPIPFTTLGYGRGVTDKITAFGNLHMTSLLFGNLQADAGCSIGLKSDDSHYGFSVSPAVQVAYNLRNKTGFRLWPTLDLNAYLHPNKKNSYAYAGVNSWFELSAKKAHDQTQVRRLIPNTHLGYVFVRTKWQHQFELAYLAMGIANTPGVVEYIGVSGKGSLGIHYSLIKKF